MTSDPLGRVHADVRSGLLEAAARFTSQVLEQQLIPAILRLNFGDADSVGFFQMRVGIWNQGAYAGYPEKPELQAKWFIDQALAVKKKAIASGDADFGKDPARFGEWIANVERPAEPFRGRYQLRLGEARKLLS